MYEADNSVVLLASEAGTKITFDAKVSALRALELGNGKGDLGISASSEKSFRSIGKAGVVGLVLFKLGWFGGTKLLGDAKIESEESLDDDL